jgi:PAS domain S-box-containing protein
MKAPLPPNEAQRLAALAQYQVLDTPPEQAFDDLTLLAAHICQTPIALVSLVDEMRQWFKSRLGFSATETARDIAFCAHTILHPDEVLEVRDAKADPRFADNPLVTGDANFRFYAGAPLITPEGHALGALCVIDNKPRTLTAEQLAALRALSRHVVSQLELQRQTQVLMDEAVERERAEELLNEQFTELTASKQETERLLVRAEKLRLALLSMFEDEKRAGKKLRESEERFRQLADNINEVFWITDPTMHELVYVSPAYEKIWGRTCASLQAAPRQWREAIHPEDSGRVAKAAADILNSGSYEATYRILRPDKTERWIHDKGFPARNAAGEIHRIVGTAQDITERRVLEEQFRQAQKMESLGQLAGGIAHDFNNILSAMVGNIYLVKMDAGENPAVVESLDELTKAVQRATDLVKQILTFSRQNKPERTTVKLNDVVMEAIKLLRASVPATIRIQTELAEVPAVLANATAIHQVVMNLGTNAWHAMRGQAGVLKIEMHGLEADEALVKAHPDLVPGRYVELSVSDTGCGMERAVLDHIFEPFFTTKGVGEGTGLGLAVVHGIMKSHDGGIAVDSEPGKGTTFHLYFPVIETEAVEWKIEATSIPRGRGEHILFVDDEDVLASLGKKMLERLGYVVTTLTNPLEAITAVRYQPGAFALVITDLAMPGMDGTQLGRELLQLQPDLPIILTTGYSAMTNEKVREIGFRELLNKPGTARTLGEAVHRALQTTAKPKI